MVVGVFPQGYDDQGRPGALAFHGLFVTWWTYWRAGLNPFVFAPALRSEWNEADQDAILPPRTLILPGRQVARANVEWFDDRVETIVAILRRRRRVVVPSAEPIDDLARAVWTKLPGSVRRRASVATWAFCNDNLFDLVAVPRMAGIISDPSEIVLDAPVEDGHANKAGVIEGPEKRGEPRQQKRLGGFLVLLVGLTVLSAGLAWWRFPRSEPLDRLATADQPQPRGEGAERQPTQEGSPPAKRMERALGSEERRRLNEAIVDLVEQFGPLDSEASIPGAAAGRPWPEIEETQPIQLMIRLAERLRYHGRSLSAEDLDGLRGSAESLTNRPGNDAAAGPEMACPGRPLRRRSALAGRLQTGRDCLAARHSRLVISCRRRSGSEPGAEPWSSRKKSFTLWRMP